MKPQVAVVLGYYDGLEYIQEQLNSIREQVGVDVQIYIFDDWSPIPLQLDQLKLASADLDRIKITRRSRNLNFSDNFLLGLAECPNHFDYYAFSDQDDIWDRDKLLTAVAAISHSDDQCPALYCSRTRIVADCGIRELGFSPLFEKKPSFAGALVQNIGGGNTMVMNASARELVVAASFDTAVVSHDWWAYLVVSGVGGKVIYDPEAHVSYRQHGKNAVGANSSFKARFQRFLMLFSGRFKRWNSLHCIALRRNKEYLTEYNSELLESFCDARQKGGLSAIRVFDRLRIERQTLFGQIGLKIGLLFRKI